MAVNKHGDKTAEELVAEFDTGARNLVGWQQKLIPYICFIWALYQLYAASPIPSMLSAGLGIDFFYYIAISRSPAKSIWRLHWFWRYWPTLS